MVDFVKKNWQFRDIISENELNRIEDGIEEGITKAEQADQKAQQAQQTANQAASDLAAHLNDITTVPTPNKIPKALETGKLDAGWLDGINPACILTYQTNQAIANDTLTIVNWDTVIFDRGNFYSPSVQNRITIQQDGIYLIVVNLVWESFTTGDLLTRIFLNGVTTIATVQKPCASTIAYEESNVIRIAQLTAGDYLQIQVRQTSGGSKNLLAGTDAAFAVVKIG